MSVTLRTIFVLVGAAGAYLLWAGQADAQELGAALACAAAAAGCAALLAKAGGPAFAFDLAALKILAKALAGVPAGAWRAALTLASPGPVRGQVELRPAARVGGRDESQDRTRRGAELIAKGMAPDAYPIQVVREGSCLEMHVLNGGPRRGS